MQPVIFTMEQANAMIPVLSAMLRDIFSLNGRIKALAKDIEDLVEIWGKEVFEIVDLSHFFPLVDAGMVNALSVFFSEEGMNHLALGVVAATQNNRHRGVFQFRF